MLQGVPSIAFHVKHVLLPTLKSGSMGIAQFVGRMHAPWQTLSGSAVSPPGQPRVQLMMPAAQELVVQTLVRAGVGAPGLKTHVQSGRQCFKPQGWGTRRLCS